MCFTPAAEEMDYLAYDRQAQDRGSMKFSLKKKNNKNNNNHSNNDNKHCNENIEIKCQTTKQVRSSDHI